MKNIKTVILLSAILSGTVLAQGNANTAATSANSDSSTPAATGASAEMTEAEVRKVDKENSKITLKHGEIKNLEMPAMTMVFQVADTAMLDKVKAGDKVRFKAGKDGGKLVVTEIVQAK